MAWRVVQWQHDMHLSYTCADDQTQKTVDPHMYQLKCLEVNLRTIEDQLRFRKYRVAAKSSAA